MLCTFPGGGYVHFEIDTLDTITLLENGGYPVIVSMVLGYLVIVSIVLRVKCYGVQSIGLSRNSIHGTECYLGYCLEPGSVLC